MCNIRLNLICTWLPWVCQIQLEGGGHYTVLKDERGLDRRLAVKRMPWRRINSLRGEVQEVSKFWRVCADTGCLPCSMYVVVR